MSDIEKIHGITPDLTRENVDRLLALFPDVATEITDPKTGRTERAVDFDALKERLSDVAATSSLGPANARRNASPANPSPRPCDPSRNAARTGTPPGTCTSRETTSTR